MTEFLLRSVCVLEWGAVGMFESTVEIWNFGDNSWQLQQVVVPDSVGCLPEKLSVEFTKSVDTDKVD